ncbi:methionine--tRNA ligase mes1 [Hamiltosporidium tvaerminnensis]|nr:methionine--tRNA ligase mes1 [Hamiltosporidium tvaerminnensis]
MKKLITSALPYVNNLPHLGNIVGCVLSADVYTRFCKKRGQKAIHICGTDEYGTATEMTAIEQNLHPKEIVDKNSVIHKNIYDWFEIHFDHFGRTTDDDHVIFTQKIFKEIYRENYFEEKTSEQYFCLKCELFLADRYLLGTCPSCSSERARGDQCDDCGYLVKALELKLPKCSICKEEPVIRKTKHLYLRLDLLKPQIKKIIEEKSESWSDNAKAIANHWINLDLHSRSMTRDLKYRWGVGVPVEGFEDKVLYVWFDAPIGYLTFTKQCLKEEYDSFVDDCVWYQFMGKDNVPFHSIIFPGMLLATKNKYPIVSTINSTEYLMYENDKFSKSRNVGIFGSDLLNDTKGPASIWRFYLIKCRPENKDTNFSVEDFIQTVKSDLINNFGNFCNRSLKFFEEKMKRNLEFNLNEEDKLFISQINDSYSQYLSAMERIELKNGLKIFMEISNAGNKYLQDNINDKERRKTVFSVGVSLVVLLGHICEPFMPSITKKIFKMIEVENTEIFPEKFEVISKCTLGGTKIIPLFEPVDGSLIK